MIYVPCTNAGARFGAGRAGRFVAGGRRVVVQVPRARRGVVWSAAEDAVPGGPARKALTHTGGDRPPLTHSLRRRSGV